MGTITKQRTHQSETETHIQRSLDEGATNHSWIGFVFGLKLLDITELPAFLRHIFITLYYGTDLAVTRLIHLSSNELKYVNKRNV